MDFYPAKNHDRLNGKPFAPEAITGRAMVNPHYRLRLAPGARYIIDSGAFQERDMRAWLQPWSALDRQLRFEAQIEYRGHGGHAEALITYDMLDGVDEALDEGARVKRRSASIVQSRGKYMRCRLSGRKTHRLAQRLQMSIVHATVRGGEGHTILFIAADGQEWAYQRDRQGFTRLETTGFVYDMRPRMLRR